MVKLRSGRERQRVRVVVTIHDAADMTNVGRRLLAIWLRKVADDVEASGSNYGGLFRSRYFTRLPGPFVEGRSRRGRGKR